MFPRQLAAKQAAAAATQTIAAAQNAAASNKNTVSHQQLVHSCKVTQLIVVQCGMQIKDTCGRGLYLPVTRCHSFLTILFSFQAEATAQMMHQVVVHVQML